MGDRVAQPKLPRKRNVPRRFQIGAASPEHPASAKDQHRMEYVLALDHLIDSITQRFQQKGYEMYRNLQDVIVKACNGESFVKQLSIICDFYGSDLSKPDLEVQLQTLSVHFKSQIPVILDDIHKYMLTIKCDQRPFYSVVIKVLQLILVMPATNASSKRSFSAVRCLKNYLRSTMSQQRLNNLMVLHVHGDVTDSLDLKKAAQRFIKNHGHRTALFGRFC